MADYPFFPYSPTLDGFPVDEISGDLIRDIAEEARQAFFKVVCDRLDDLYPGSKTYGDESPGEMSERDAIAYNWVMSHAWNNSAVQAYNSQPCSYQTSEVYVPESLMSDWPEGITSVDIRRGVEFPGLTATIRGTRTAICDYILTHWDGTDDLEEWFGDIVADEDQEVGQ